MIIYEDSLENITPDQLQGFFVGWPKPPSTDTHLKILQQSSYFVIAIDEKTSKVVGFINSISDNIMSVYIPLLEVLPEYQKKGIGKELVKRVLNKFKNLYMVDLTCDIETQPFYEKLDLRKSTGMMIRNFDMQACIKQ